MWKVIVADCTPSVCALVKNAFSGPDFEVYPFSDGVEMLAQFEDINPDVILLNLFLHSKDGYDVCRYLNLQEKFRSIPVFLLYGAFDRLDEERMKDLNYRELIAEPFDSVDLFRKIRDVLGGESEPSSLPEEPITAEVRASEAELDSRIKTLVSEQLRGIEDRILSRLRQASEEREVDQNKGAESGGGDE